MLRTPNATLALKGVAHQWLKDVGREDCSIFHTSKMDSETSNSVAPRARIYCAIPVRSKVLVSIVELHREHFGGQHRQQDEAARSHLVRMSWRLKIACSGPPMPTHASIAVSQSPLDASRPAAGNRAVMT